MTSQMTCLLPKPIMRHGRHEFCGHRHFPHKSTKYDKFLIRQECRMRTFTMGWMGSSRLFFLPFFYIFQSDPDYAIAGNPRALVDLSARLLLLEEHGNKMQIKVERHKECKAVTPVQTSHKRRCVVRFLLRFYRAITSLRAYISESVVMWVLFVYWFVYFHHGLLSHALSTITSRYSTHISNLATFWKTVW